MVRYPAAGHGGSRALRGAAVLHVFLGLAFGLGSPHVLAYFARHGELPLSPFGWRYMAGPFERFAPEAFLALGSTLVGVSTLDVMVGIWLWRGQRRGLRLALATDFAAMALAAGFGGLPLLLGGVPLRAALAWAGRQGLEGDKRPIVREETM
jgi:hypothetical protein